MSSGTTVQVAQEKWNPRKHDAVRPGQTLIVTAMNCRTIDLIDPTRPSARIYGIPAELVELVEKPTTA